MPPGLYVIRTNLESRGAGNSAPAPRFAEVGGDRQSPDYHFKRERSINAPIVAATAARAAPESSAVLYYSYPSRLMYQCIGAMRRCAVWYVRVRAKRRARARNYEPVFDFAAAKSLAHKITFYLLERGLERAAFFFAVHRPRLLFRLFTPEDAGIETC